MKPIKYRILRDAGKLHGTIKRAVALAKARRGSGESDTLHARHGCAVRVSTLTLGSEDERNASSAAYKSRPRVENWEVEKFPSKNRGGVMITEHDQGSYSRRCKWRKITYRIEMTSYAAVSTQRIYARINTTVYRRKAPRGWRYGTDILGVYVVRQNENRESYRYHMDSDEVRGGVAAIRAGAITHELNQRRADQLKRIDNASRRYVEKLGVYVTHRDAYVAGNCRSGTLAFCRKNGLSGKCYPVDVLERVAHKAAGVGRAIDQAYRRTLADVARGYCTV